MKLILLYSLAFVLGTAIAFGIACLLGLLFPALKFPFFLFVSLWWAWNIYTVWKRARARGGVAESKRGAMADYNKLRASVGMAPAAGDDYCEAVAWVVVFDLHAPEVGDESKGLPVEERDLFMMTYATYLSWLAMRCVESKFPPGSWHRISPMLEREFSKRPWYKAEVMNRLYDSMVKYPLWGESRGKYFKSSAGPWFDAVMATNIAGFGLKHSTNSKFILYVSVMSRKTLESIGKMAPTG